MIIFKHRTNRAMWSVKGLKITCKLVLKCLTNLICYGIVMVRSVAVVYFLFLWSTFSSAYLACSFFSILYLLWLIPITLFIIHIMTNYTCKYYYLNYYHSIMTLKIWQTLYKQHKITISYGPFLFTESAEVVIITAARV